MDEYNTLYELREMTGHTQESLSRESGVGRDYISKLENNQMRLTMEASEALGEALGMDPVELKIGHTVGSLNKVCQSLEHQMPRENVVMNEEIPHQLSLGWQLVHEIVRETLGGSTREKVKQSRTKGGYRSDSMKRIWKEVARPTSKMIQTLASQSEQYGKSLQKVLKRGFENLPENTDRGSD